tara:strand:- start:275 stop:484 length:210 start_codon:yes stop_codon:yes gene_type:complete
MSNNLNKYKIKQAINDFELSKKQLTDILFKEGKVGQDDSNEEFLKFVSRFYGNTTYAIRELEENLKKIT